MMIKVLGKVLGKFLGQFLDKFLDKFPEQFLDKFPVQFLDDNFLHLLLLEVLIRTSLLHQALQQDLYLIVVLKYLVMLPGHLLTIATCLKALGNLEELLAVQLMEQVHKQVLVFEPLNTDSTHWVG